MLSTGLMIFIASMALIFIVPLAYITYMQQHLINTMNKRQLFLLARLYDSLNEYAAMSVEQINQASDKLEQQVKINEEFKIEDNQFDPFQDLDGADIT